MGSEDHAVLLRTGVTEMELTGRTWKPICLPFGPSETPEPSLNPSPSPSLFPCSSPKISSSSDTKVLSDQSSVQIVTENQQDSLSSTTDASLSTSDDVDFASMEAVLNNLNLQESHQTNTQKEKEKIAKEKKENTKNGKKEKEPETVSQGQGDESSHLDDSHETSIRIRYPEDYPSSLSSSVMSDHSEASVNSLQASVGCIMLNDPLLSSQNTASDGKSEEKVSEQEDKVDVKIQEQPEVKSLTDTVVDKLQVKIEHQENQPLSIQQQSANVGGEWNESRLRHVSGSSAGSEASLSHRSLVVPREEGPNYNLLSLETEHLWLWVTGGGCWIQANNMPKW